MVGIKMGQQRVSKTWRKLIVDQVKIGKVVPIIGHTVANNFLLGGHEQMVKAFAEYLAYPKSGEDDLALQRAGPCFVKDARCGSTNLGTGDHRFLVIEP